MKVLHISEDPCSVYMTRNGPKSKTDNTTHRCKYKNKIFQRHEIVFNISYTLNVHQINGQIISGKASLNRNESRTIDR